MSELAVLKEHGVKYRLTFCKGNRLVLKYDRKGILTIRSPKDVKIEEIEKFIYHHLDWILNNYSKSQPQIRKYEEMETYLYLGKTYHLSIVYSRHEGVFIKDEKLIIYALSKENIKNVLEKWKYTQAENIFNELLYQAFMRMKEELPSYPKLMVKKYLSRWGCCYPFKNQIVLNIALIHVPLALIEYVVYHELCHLKYANHQPIFHQFLRKYYPNEQEARKKLKLYHTDYE